MGEFKRSPTPARRVVNVVIELANPADAARALGDGYPVEVRIVVWRQDDVLVPRRAN